jgi:hypothetical protein
MYTGLVVTVIILLFGLFFVVYKRDKLSQLFSLNAIEPANEFQVKLEQTANAVIDRLETQMAHLEYLLEEANNRIEMLNRQVQAADRLLKNLATTAPNLASEQALLSIEQNGKKDSESQESPIPNAMPQGEPAKLTPGNKNRRHLILEMSEQGYNVTEIAKATGIGKGEIMLLLQLNKK